MVTFKDDGMSGCVKRCLEKFTFTIYFHTYTAIPYTSRGFVVKYLMYDFGNTCRKNGLLPSPFVTHPTFLHTWLVVSLGALFVPMW